MYQQKEFTQFCGDLYKLATAQSTVNEFAALLKVDTVSLEMEHYTICSKVLNGLALVLLQTVGAKHGGSVELPFRKSEEFNTEE